MFARGVARLCFGGRWLAAARCSEKLASANRRVVVSVIGWVPTRFFYWGARSRGVGSRSGLLASKFVEWFRPIDA